MMTEEHSSMAMNSITWAMDRIQYEWVNAAVYMQEAMDERRRPTSIMKPKVYPDGDMWCCLYGDNIQDGVAGFGETPDAACRQFDREWLKGKAVRYET